MNRLNPKFHVSISCRFTIIWTSKMEMKRKNKIDCTKPLNLGLTLPKNEQPTPLNISRAPPKKDLLLTIQFQLVVLFFFGGGYISLPRFTWTNSRMCSKTIDPKNAISLTYGYTLEVQHSPWKHGAWKATFLLGPGNFQGLCVRLQEGP